MSDHIEWKDRPFQPGCRVIDTYNKSTGVVKRLDSGGAVRVEWDPGHGFTNDYNIAMEEDICILEGKTS